MERCPWCLGNQLYIRYHDEEWGVSVHEDRKHFEFLVLESAQAGLSWLTILKKRENYREAYEGFDVQKVAAFDGPKVESLLTNPGIIRNRKKIEASIHNARRFIEVQEEWGSFDAYIWSFVDGEPIINYWEDLSQVPANTELSTRISRDLKRRGFQFLGPTIIYSHMQATGIVNDHLTSCFLHPNNH